jgi:hypothetical protein
VEVIFNEVATVNLSSNIDFKDIEKELSRGAGGDITLNSGDNFGFSSDFLTKSRETRTSITFAYKTILKAGDEILSSPHRLTRQAYELAKKGRNEFEKYCGDQFVYKVSKGARAYVVVKLEVGSVEKKRIIKNEFNLNVVDLINISTTLKKMRKKYQVKGDIKIYGYQEGGFAARINSIFGNGRAFSQCSAPDLSDCQMTLAGVLDYFSNEFPLQFEPYYRGIFGAGAKALPSTSFPLIYSTQSYCKLPSTELPDTLACGEINNEGPFKKIAGLETKYVNKLGKIKRIKKKLLEGLSEEKERLLFKVESQMKSNLTKLKNARLLCSRDPWSCRSIVLKMAQDLIPLDQEDLKKIETEDRIEICVNSGLNSQIKGVEFKFLNGSHLTQPFKKFRVLDHVIPNGCFYLRDPNFNFTFNGLEVSVLRYTEIDPRRCKFRRERKFYSGFFWDLKSLKVHNFMTGQKVSFKGITFKEKMRCRHEEKTRGVSKWKRLEPIY